MATRIKTTPLGRTTVRESTGQIARVAPAPVKTDTPVRPSVKRLEGTGLTAQQAKKADDSETLGGKKESDLNVGSATNADNADKLSGLTVENFTRTMHYEYVDSLAATDHPSSVENMAYIGVPTGSWGNQPNGPAEPMNKGLILGFHNEGHLSDWQINFHPDSTFPYIRFYTGTWSEWRSIVTVDSNDDDETIPHLSADLLDGFHGFDYMLKSEHTEGLTGSYTFNEINAAKTQYRVVTLTLDKGVVTNWSVGSWT
jgi:hypothetical protein